MEIDRRDNSKYSVVMPNEFGACVAMLVEKSYANDILLPLLSIGRSILPPDVFDSLRGLSAESSCGIQLADAMNICAQKDVVEIFRLYRHRHDCGSLDGYMQASSHEYQKRLVV